MKREWSNLLFEWPFLLGLIIVCFFFALEVVGYNFSYFPGDLGDARFSMYMFEHSYQFFLGNEASFWEASFMYPEPKIITYSENFIGSAPFYSVFRLFGANRETAFQLWFVLMFLLNYLCAYLFLNWQFNNKHAAVIGALVFTCSMAIQSQMTHAQTFPRFPVPLAFWMAMIFIKNLKPFYLFGSILMVVYQFYCSIYLGFFLLVPIGVLLFFGMLLKRKLAFDYIKNLKWVSLIVGSVIINILILIPLMLPYYIRAKVGGMNSYESVVATLPTIRSFFYSQKGSFFWSNLTEIGSDYPAPWDHQIFTGGLAMLSLILFSIFLLSFFLKQKWVKSMSIDVQTKALFFTAIVVFLLFVRYQGFSFYQVLFKLPGFGSLRSLTRVINIELIFFAFSTTFIVSQLFNKYKKYTTLLFLCLSIIFVADNYFKGESSYRTEKIITEQRVDALVNKMKDIPAGSVVSYEPQFEGNSYPYQIDAMLAGQTLGLKMVNGYTATSPYGYDGFWREMSEETRNIWLNTMEISADNIFIIH
jgi:hypothetical protein